ncbi:hypothetical protein HKX48_004198 [Thoreauomyces humboldtii]|nr:hypothetical protein HKX48_004198 [Thoreauomyces humboldtii]
MSAFPHHVDDRTGLPILHNCLGVLICRAVKHVEVGDHQCWFGEVVGIVHGVGGSKKDTDKVGRKREGGPLVYYESQYRSVGDQVFMTKIEDGALSIREWTHRAHLRMAWNYLRDTPDQEEAAYVKIRAAILSHNKTNGHLLKHPFNETMTRLYFHLVRLAVQDDVRSRSNDDETPDFLDFLARYPFLEDAKLKDRFYTEDVLLGVDARERFVPPNRAPLPTTLAELLSPVEDVA